MKTSLYGAVRARRAAAGDNAPALSGDAPPFTPRRRGRQCLALALACAALVAGGGAVSAQRVYGVSARRTTVVATGAGVAVRSTTVVVAARPALPAGYIAVLPGGYRAVVVRGARYYSVGGIYYRASFYQGRTVYIRTNI